MCHQEIFQGICREEKESQQNCGLRCLSSLLIISYLCVFRECKSVSFPWDLLPLYSLSSPLLPQENNSVLLLSNTQQLPLLQLQGSSYRDAQRWSAADPASASAHTWLRTSVRINWSRTAVLFPGACMSDLNYVILKSKFSLFQLTFRVIANIRTSTFCIYIWVKWSQLFNLLRQPSRAVLVVHIVHFVRTDQSLTWTL